MNLNDLYEEMEQLALRSGIEKFKYARIKERIDTGEQYDELEIIYTAFYLPVKKVWDLRSPAQWAYYDAFGITGLVEQNLLTETLKPFKRALNNEIRCIKVKENPA